MRSFVCLFDGIVHRFLIVSDGGGDGVKVCVAELEIFLWISPCSCLSEYLSHFLEYENTYGGYTTSTKGTAKRTFQFMSQGLLGMVPCILGWIEMLGRHHSKDRTHTFFHSFGILFLE